MPSGPFFGEKPLGQPQVVEQPWTAANRVRPRIFSSPLTSSFLLTWENLHDLNVLYIVTKSEYPAFFYTHLIRFVLPGWGLLHDHRCEIKEWSVLTSDHLSYYVSLLVLLPRNRRTGNLVCPPLAKKEQTGEQRGWRANTQVAAKLLLYRDRISVKALPVKIKEVDHSTSSSTLGAHFQSFGRIFFNFQVKHFFRVNGLLNRVRWFVRRLISRSFCRCTF